MKKFSIDEYRGNYVMHLKSKIEANIFGRYLNALGLNLINGSSYLNRSDDIWKVYKDKTIFYFNEGTFGSIEDVKDFNTLEFSDFYFPVGIAANSEKDNFTLSEIENGMIVKTENDFMRIRIGDYFYRLEGTPIYIDNSRKDLWVYDMDDICEIYRIDINKQLSLEQILSANLTDSHIKVWSKSEGCIE